MSKLQLNWALTAPENPSEVRYCPNCGRKVDFTDSGLRRHNANGKNIFVFAIYKCESGHTWNKNLGIHKAGTPGRPEAPADSNDWSEIARINLAALAGGGIREVEISLTAVAGKWRLDKLLARQIEDVSRTRIEKMIVAGKIVVNDQNVSPNAIVTEGHTIRIMW